MTALRKGGCIINISSLLAYKAAIGTSVYAATKAGQLGMTTPLLQ
jgi:NAD(P)-dependent dehydrogenase (short-subunit alcohol dehydrogenase family)